MRVTKELIVFVCLIAFINFCKGQTGKYREQLRPKIKAKLDSLYPHATSEISLNNPFLSDTTQTVSINCHCDETEGAIILVFDTNTNVLYKEVHFHSQKNLPDTIIKYMQKDTTKGAKYITDYMLKCYDRKGKLSYGIIERYAPEQWHETEYMLKFKPSGELISKEEMDMPR